MTAMPIDLRIARPQNEWQVMLVFLPVLLVFVLGTLAWTVRETYSFADPPEEIRDGVFYDNIAHSLASGRGFSYDFQDPQWREKYRQANRDPDFRGQYAWALRLKTKGSTTDKPPGYPFLLSLLYRVFGWRWEVVRVFGCLAASLGLATLVTWAWTRWGAIAALTSIITLMLDFSVMTYAGYILTESIATSLMCIWFVILVRGMERPSWAVWISAGVVLALLIYVRSNWSLWLLAMLVISPLLLWSCIRQLILPVKPVQILTFLATCVLLIAPWWARNCMVSGHFQPFATTGTGGLIGAYCDESFAEHGEWQSKVFNEHVRAVEKKVDHSSLTRPQWEYEVARDSTKLAIDWAMKNWQRLPQLAIYRWLSNWGLYQPFPIYLYAANVWLLLLGGAGVFLSKGRVRDVLLLILLLNSAVVMATWSHQGRYAIPLRPLIHICYGLAAVSLLEWLARMAAKIVSSSSQYK